MSSPEALSFITTPPPPPGVLIVNTGSPGEPTSGALRGYLREFLWDPRIVDVSRPLWWLILNLFILPFRPSVSALRYRQIWTADGSPLLATSRKQAEAIQESLGATASVALGMRYGRPSIADAMRSLRDQGCERLLVLPLFPQYSAPTTASVMDAVSAELSRWRVVPELRFVNHYHDDEAYLRAIESSIREHWARAGEPDRLLFSFHGMPARYREAGDPYFWQCHRTARAVAQALGLVTTRWQVSFQSRFGYGEWTQPYTDRLVEEWAHEGVASLDIICPGFSADCLETLEEIDISTRALFLRSGGRRFRYIPALNDREDHIAALSTIMRRNMEGWAA